MAENDDTPLLLVSFLHISHSMCLNDVQSDSRARKPGRCLLSPPQAPANCL